MKSIDDEFSRKLEIFRQEAEAGAQFSYSYLALAHHDASRTSTPRPSRTTAWVHEEIPLTRKALRTPSAHFLINERQPGLLRKRRSESNGVKDFA